MYSLRFYTTGSNVLTGGAYLNGLKQRTTYIHRALARLALQRVTFTSCIGVLGDGVLLSPIQKDGSCNWVSSAGGANECRDRLVVFCLRSTIERERSGRCRWGGVNGELREQLDGLPQEAYAAQTIMINP
jgi:hypothetical protein